LTRSYLPLIIAGVFALVLLAVLGVFLWRAQPVPPTQAELADAYAKGQQYQRGDGVMMDPGQALTWYRKAADGGYPQAEYALGLMTKAGQGIVRDEKAAVEWFRRAAEHGLAEAQVRLGEELLNGAVTADGKPDKVEALKWLLLGAHGLPDGPNRQAAIASREKLETELGPEDRREAARRADAWRKQRAQR
jgi:TPR repeat protein